MLGKDNSKSFTTSKLRLDIAHSLRVRTNKYFGEIMHTEHVFTIGAFIATFFAPINVSEKFEERICPFFSISKFIYCHFVDNMPIR